MPKIKPIDVADKIKIKPTVAHHDKNRGLDAVNKKPVIIGFIYNFKTV
jgi:hypothetical protein